ncbi:MAG: TfoX/Sxy family protein [Candidatus Thorarchaeota archaeon]|nr:TfoX/Sxy family protein [Candidatus Thorarchaeota archaeon]
MNLNGVEYVPKRMFGKDAYFINRNMFTGVHLSSIFLRLSPEDREEALSLEGIIEYEPRSGLVMREYVVLSYSILSNKLLLTDLFQKSIRYVSSLPPKEPKKKK